MLLKDYNTVMAEHVVQNVGKPVIFKRFAPRIWYFILNGNGLTPINLNKKSIQAYFENKINFDDFVKENKIKMNSEGDITFVKIFYY